MRVLLMPRWGGTAGSDWYPWLVNELDVPVSVVELDRPDAPTIEVCVDQLRSELAGDASRTCLVGHSVSCLAIVHLLATLPESSVPAAVFVAGWWTIDAPWKTIRPWIDTPVDTARARRAVGESHVLLSDDDPFTSDARSTQRNWRDRMGSNVQIEPGGAHFNRAQENAVRDLVVKVVRRMEP